MKSWATKRGIGVVWIIWIPDAGLPSWCSRNEWLAHVVGPDHGGFGSSKDKEAAIIQAYTLAGLTQPPRRQGELFS